MKLYADLPTRRTAQILADVGILCWTAVWAWVGRLVHDTTMHLATPGHQLQDTGAGLHDRMTQAASTLTDVPVVGDRLAEPFTSVAGTGTQVADAGTSLVRAVERLATVLGWTTALVPIVVAALVWLLLRARFVRRATAAQRFVDSAADLDLFALRAMTRQPMAKLARLSDDPAGAWRRRDPDVVARLALLELRACGLRPPAVGPQGSPST